MQLGATKLRGRESVPHNPHLKPRSSTDTEKSTDTETQIILATASTTQAVLPINHKVTRYGSRFYQNLCFSTESLKPPF